MNDENNPRYIDAPSDNLADACIKFLVKHPKVTSLIIKTIVASSRAKKAKFCAEYLFDSYRLFRKGIKNIFRKEAIGRAPRRLESPVKDGPNAAFEANIDTGKKSPYDQAMHYIITPSTFNEDNNDVHRYRGKLIETSTGYLIEALTPDSIDGCEMRVKVIDDQYEAIPYEEIFEQAAISMQKVVISLTGIQTNQYPRAYHIATKIKAEAIRRGIGGTIDILFGGYHIRSKHKESIEEITSSGFTAVAGEMEDGKLGEVLTDTIHNRLQPTYVFSHAPELRGNSMPVYSPGNAAKVVQLSRGCPFDCTFCAVTAIDGKKMRCRTKEESESIFKLLHKNGTKSIFVADDNFYRNKNRMEILKKLIALKREGMKFDIMIQCDLQVETIDTSVASEKGKVRPKIVDTEFMDRCAEAGVDMIFVGSESFDFEVLEGMNKTRNQTAETFIANMREQCQAWQKRGIAVGFTCIVGNKGDTEGVGQRSAEMALNNIGANLLIPFPFTFLPGSKDYFHFVKGAGKDDYTLEPVRNELSVSRATINWKDGLQAKQVDRELEELLNAFYQPENMKKACPTVAAARHFLWYMISARLGLHAMNNAMWRRVRTEQFVEEEFRRDEKLCLENG
jgi:hypothetical protein